MKQTEVNQPQKLAYNLIILIAIVFILKIMKPFLVPLFFSIILSIMLFPVVVFLEKKLRFNRIFSTLSVIFLLGIIVSFLIWIIGYKIGDFINQSDAYTQKLTELFNQFSALLEDNFGISQQKLINNIKIETLIKQNVSRITDFLVSSTSLLSDLLLIPIYIFFLLLYRDFFVSFIHKLFVNLNNDFLNTVLGKIYDVQKNYLSGLFTVMIIVGVLNSIGLLLLGIENAIFFGFFASLLLLIPYIGITIGSLLPALVALITKDSAWYSVGVIAIFLFVQFLEGNFITPKITGSKVNVNAFVAIISLLLFSMLWGTAGMILALPVTATLKVLFDHTPGLEAYGYLIGEPEEEKIVSKARFRLTLWKKRKKVEE